MDELLEIGSTLLVSALSTVLAGAGVVVEWIALGDLTHGALILGAWEATLGAILLVGGLYALGYQSALPRLRELT